MANEVFIDGDSDTIQLRVQGYSTQTEPLQTWENSPGTTVLAQLSKDGYLQMGDDVLGWSTPDALIEAHRDSGSATKPKRGFHSLGRITNLLTDVIAWAVSELELLGTAGVSGLQTALRIKLTHNNTGSSTSADLRAGDFQSINQTGSSGARVGQVTGVQGTASNTPSGASAYLTKAVGVEGAVTNATGGDITDAAAFEVAAPVNNGTIANLYGLRVPDLTQGNTNFAILTGLGPVRLGDFVELKRPAVVPGQPATDLIRVYPKSDGKLYAKNWNNQEFDLTSSTPGGAPIAGLCHGRLTLSSGTPVPITDVLATTTVYFAPYQGNQVSLYDGSQWNVHTWSEVSIKLTDTQNGTTAIGSAVVTGLTNTSQFIVGMNVSGTGIPANSIIQSINSSTQITLNQNATASGTASLTFTMPANTPYDIFIYNNAGVLALEIVAWNAPANGAVTSISSSASPREVTVPSHTLSTGQLVTIAGNSVASNNATWRVGTTTSTTFRLLNLDGSNSVAPGTPGTGGTWQRADQNTDRATLLALQDGAYVKSGATTRRYLGTIRTTNVAGQCEDSVTKRFVWNYYQQAARQLLKMESTNNWSYGGQSWRRARNLDANRVEVVVGVAGAPLELAVHVLAIGSSGAVTPVVGIGEDTTSNNSADIWQPDSLNSATSYGTTSAFLQRYPLGYHYYQWVELSAGASTASFYSYSNNLRRSGLKGWIWG